MMTQTDIQMQSQKYWSRSASVLLIFVGLMLALVSFGVVISMGTVPWHGARDAELSATYDTYRETGVLLIKPTGSGSYGAQAPAPGPLSAATWDDDPGAYIVASLLSHITHSDSPYPGLALAQGLLIALPLLWLPTAVARTFKSARAGYALIFLPPVVWIINHGAVFVGTEYGLSDSSSPMRVYAVYGLAASLAFLSLSLLLLLSTFRLKWSALIALSVLFGVLAGFGNLLRSYSGIGVAVCVGVLWWLRSTRRWRTVVGVLGSTATVVLAVLVQTGVMAVINTARVEATGQTLQQLPDAHALWHSMYMGLSYPEPITGLPSRFGVTWSDEYGWEKAREVDPDVVIASAHYDAILKDLYWEKVASDPWGAVKLYAQKTMYVAGHFSGMIAFIFAGFGLALLRKGPHRKPVVIGLLISVPMLFLGLAPPILVMPLLYYYSELSAALGLLSVIALGSLVWSLSTFPAVLLGAERDRLITRKSVAPSEIQATSSTTPVSVVVMDWRDRNTLERTHEALGTLLSPGSELIIVRVAPLEAEIHPATCLEDDAAHSYRQIVLKSSAGVGDQLRAGVLASRGDRVLLLVDSAFVTEKTVRDITHPSSEPLAIGEVLAPERADRGFRYWLVRFFREALLPPGTTDSPVMVWANGEWIRLFAQFSRENGQLWTTELVVAAGQQGIETVTVPLPAPRDGEPDSPLEPVLGVFRSLSGFARVALHKDEYAFDSAARSGSASGTSAHLRD